MATYALKVRDDDPIAKFMDGLPNKSEFLKELVQAYLDAHSGKPGVNRPQEPPQPDDHWIEALEAAVYRGTRRALQELQIAIPANGALNAEAAAPVAVERDTAMDEILAGLGSWGS